MIFSDEFNPTTLCVKQHTITKLKYFCKTTKSNFVSYPGSGKYWDKHLKKHGNKIETIWSKTFTDKKDLMEFALFFSEFYNIVNGKNSYGKKIWANEIPENGIDGWPRGQKRKPLSEKQKKEHSAKMSGNGNPMWGVSQKESTKQLIGKKATGRKHSTKTKKIKSEQMSGEGNPMYGRRGQSSPHYGIKKPEHSQRMSGEGNPFYNQKHSEETLEKLRVPKPLISCVGCRNIVGGNSNLVRWHKDCI